MLALVIALAQAEPPAGQIEQIATTFGVDWPHLAAQTISFAIVCACLYLFAYRPILDVLEVRRRQIAQGLANAERIEAELIRTKAERQNVLRQARQEATRLIENARASAAHVRAQEIDKAIAAATDIVSKARQTAASDRERMMSDLRREMGRLVVRTTGIVTGKILTADDERRLFEETARQLIQ